jgi:hypothetical protein
VTTNTEDRQREGQKRETVARLRVRRTGRSYKWGTRERPQDIVSARSEAIANTGVTSDPAASAILLW